MGYRYYNRDEKRLQRKLIPLNIVVAILSLVAAISLMFTPLLTFNVGNMISAYADMSGEENGSGESSGETNAMMNMLKGLDTDISITPFTFLNIALADEDKKAETLLGDLLVESGFVENLVVSTVNTMMVEGIGVEEGVEVNYDELNEALKELENAKNEAEFKTAVDNYISDIEKITGDFDEDMKSDITDVMLEAYDMTVDKVGAENYSLETLLCTIMTESMSESGMDVEFTSYNDLLTAMFDGSLQGGGEEGGSPMGNMGETIAAMNEYIGYLGYGFYAMCFFAGLWAILFLFSFFHMFAKNKRFTMWYVKLLGCYPCLIFFVLPQLAKIILPQVIPEMALMVPLIGCITTMTWISGICYLLLWAVSIFWAFPIKHKIRKLRG